MARRRPATTHGLCVVDKPAGVTSHDVVGMLRKRFGERQVGHAGTLDPDATGVLVVAVGMATKLLRFVESTTKAYTGEVVLGTETSTLDAAGAVTATHDMAGVTVDAAREVVQAHLIGDIEQIPPMVSAVKIDGKRLHELARAGKEVERAPDGYQIKSEEVFYHNLPPLEDEGLFLRPSYYDAVGFRGHLDVAVPGTGMIWCFRWLMPLNSKGLGMITGRRWDSS